MSQLTERPVLKIPDRMRSKLERYQRKIWTVKLIEGVCAAAFGLLISYLVVFVLDRFVDTSSTARLAILLAGCVGVGLWLPWMMHRWVWKSRKLEQVARMLKINHPRLGDYLLGIIELVNNRSFDGTSESLCRAALEQADRETSERDFSDAVPYPTHKRWAMIAGVPLLIAAVVLVVVPAAGGNAMARWLMPWSNIDRFTFTRIQPLPEKMVVPLAEQTPLVAALTGESRWRPDSGAIIVEGNRFEADRSDANKAHGDQFDFQLPPLNAPANVLVRVGDVRETIALDPQPRPELSALTATIELPEYLQRTKPLRKDIRGGALTTLVGSTVAFHAVATRDLQSATVDGVNLQPEGNSIQTSSINIAQPRVLEMQWLDAMGLSAKTPLKLKLRCAEDAPPELTCRDLVQQHVIMEKDLLTFKVDADDDFGVKTIGLQWEGKPADTSAAEPANGEKIVFAGNPEAEAVESITATFSPERESIEPQTIELRLFAEDYLPGRERVYSAPFTVFVLSEDEHAIWMTRRLDEWFKQSLETYEQEQQLYKHNLAIRNMDAEELDRPEVRRRIKAQAAAEESQSRRLGALTKSGSKLVTEAARNGQFGVDHLEKLAEMIQALKDIEENRMPSVADLLKKASQAEAQPGPPQQAKASKSPPASVTDSPENPGKQASAAPEKAGDKPDDKKKLPSITMKESDMNAEKDKPQEPVEPSPPKKDRLLLPKVKVAALPDDGDDPPASCPAGEQMEEATDAQEDLLAEFQKVAEELQKLISNLEGSTFVKRLKAMSRRELVIARDVNQSTLVGFGEIPSKLKEATVDRSRLLAKRQKAHSQNLQTIEDDLEAYSNRVREGKFKTVLAEMRELDIVKQTQSVADRMISNEPGTSIAQAEMLADTFDRWAEQLVGPG